MLPLTPLNGGSNSEFVVYKQMLFMNPATSNFAGGWDLPRSIIKSQQK